MGYTITTAETRNPDVATAEDFATWRKRGEAMDTAALVHTIRDCREAAVAMRGHNPEREGRYEDEASTYADILRARRAA